MIRSKNIPKKEVANLVGVSASSIARWSKQGDFPRPFLLGQNKIFWDKDEIQEWMDNKKKVRGFLGYKPKKA